MKNVSDKTEGRGESILVVDDNAELRRVSIRVLTRLGYRCEQAESGPVALTLLADQAFEMLLTDVGLPDGMSGFELAKLAVRRQPGLKVLYATGYASAVDEVGEDERSQVLLKPYRSEELAAKVRSILDSDG